jgi:hypothetical protein
VDQSVEYIIELSASSTTVPISRRRSPGTKRTQLVDGVDATLKCQRCGGNSLRSMGFIDAGPGQNNGLG